VIPPAFAAFFDRMTAQAGGGPYDVVLVAVRSCIPFQPRDGSPSLATETYYGQAFFRSGLVEKLQVNFHDIPLFPLGANGNWLGVEMETRRATRVTLGPEGQKGVVPFWEVSGDELTPKFISGRREAFDTYPRKFRLEIDELPVRLLDDPRLGVFEYQLRQNVVLRAPRGEDVPPGDLPAAVPTHGTFLIGTPTLRWGWLTVPATADGDAFTATVPSGNTVFGGVRPAVQPEEYVVFRSFSYQPRLVEHHLPNRSKQLWLFVTVDEVAVPVRLR
jgi:hypothetical protein